MAHPKFSVSPSVLLVALGLAALSSPSSAAVPLKTLGFDDMSCRAWVTSNADADQRTLYISWLRGLLTGHNYARPSQQVSAISSGTIEQYVNRYCRDNPTGTFLDAGLRLTDQFSGRNSPITK